MATFTSKASGNWDTSGQVVWNEAGIPGNGDTVTISTHHIVVVNALTVGAGTSTDAINVSGSGSITFRANTTAKGNVAVSGASAKITVDAATVGSDVILTIESSGASNAWLYAKNAAVAGRRIELLGSATARAKVVGSALSTGAVQFNETGNDAATNACTWYFRYATISGLSTTVATTKLGHCDWDYVLFDGVGIINVGSDSNTGDFDFSLKHLDIRNPTSSTGLQVSCQGTPTTGRRLLSGFTYSRSSGANLISWTLQNSTIEDFVMENGYFRMMNSSGTMKATGSTIQRGMFANYDGSSAQTIQLHPNSNITIDKVVWSRCFSTGVNTRGVDERELSNAGISGSTMTNCVLDGWASQTVGDWVLNGGTWTLENNIAVNGFGNLFDGFGGLSGSGSFGAVTARHNTLVDAQGTGSGNRYNGAIAMGEKYTNADKVRDIRSNIFYGGPHGICTGADDSALEDSKWIRQSNFTLDYNGAYSTIFDQLNWYRSDNTNKSYVAKTDWRPMILDGASARSSTGNTGSTSTSIKAQTGVDFVAAGIQIGDIAGAGTDAGAAAIECAVITAVTTNTLTLGQSLKTANSNGISGFTSGTTYHVVPGLWSDGSIYGSATGRGANDLYANPQFANYSGATLKAWAVSLGASGTDAQIATWIRDEALKRHGWDRAGSAATPNTSVTPAAALLYMQTALTPTNAAYRTAAHDSTTIGAVQMTASTNNFFFAAP